MKIAVLTLCRDRVEYTRSCFDSLRANAGIDYDHFVLDQGSEDSTWDYLLSIPLKERIRLEENIGLCPGLNRLLDAGAAEGYDVVVRYDNDCEVLQPDTLRTVAELTLEHDLILSPRVLGLLDSPVIIGEFAVDGLRILETTILGGIFMAIPAVFFTRDGFRYDEDNPPWAGDEKICDWYRNRGGRCGYVAAFEVNHVEAIDGQLARYPDYVARKTSESTKYEERDSRRRRTNAIKRGILRMPLGARLNERLGLFYPPGYAWEPEKRLVASVAARTKAFLKR
jgi:hypothetical protein